MKISHRLAGIAWALLASLLSLPAAAADPETGVYFHAGVGANWADDLDVEIAGISGSVDLDVGARLGLGVGYNFNKYMGVEFDTGFLWNDFDDFDASFWHLPFMVNGVFRYPNASGFEPYLGGGVGGSLDILYVDDFGIEDTDTDFNFAWQFLAGVRYMIQENMSARPRLQVPRGLEQRLRHRRRRHRPRRLGQPLAQRRFQRGVLRHLPAVAGGAQRELVRRVPA